MKRTLIGTCKFTVCDRCIVRCENWYEDNEDGRWRLTLCPICGNGDPQLDVNDCDDPNLDEKIRTMLRLMKEE